MGFLGAAVSYICFSIVHFVCLILAVAVCGLYGQDLHHANQKHVYTDSKWVYAVVVGGLSAATCVIYALPFVLRIGGIVVPIWDFILFILWITLFGIFGKMYINEDPQGQSGIERMKDAVWVDLASALLWLFLSIGALAYWWKHRDTRTRFTGRAQV